MHMHIHMHMHICTCTYADPDARIPSPQVQVELKKGETILIDASLHHSAASLHEAFSYRSGVPPDHFELYYRGKRLEGEAALVSWGVGRDSTIEVKMRGRGGMSPGGSDGAGGSDGGGGIGAKVTDKANVAETNAVMEASSSIVLASWKRVWTGEADGAQEKQGEPLMLDTAPKMAVHGSYVEHVQDILKQGLSRKDRHPVHLAKGLSGEKSVVSGMRAGSEVFIWVNVHEAIKDGLTFYESADGGILCGGYNGDGIIPPAYFSVVLELHGGFSLDIAQVGFTRRAGYSLQSKFVLIAETKPQLYFES